MTRADINLEQIHNYVMDLFASAGLKDELLHYILNISCDDDPVFKTLVLNLEVRANSTRGHPFCVSIITTKNHTFDYNTPIDEFAYQIAKMTREINDTLGNEKTHPIPLNLPKGWYRDLYLPKKVDMFDTRFWPDVIDHAKFAEEKKKQSPMVQEACAKHGITLNKNCDWRTTCLNRRVDPAEGLADMILKQIDPIPVKHTDYTNQIIFNKGDDTMNYTAEQKKALDQINLDASAKQAELEADRQKAIEDLKNDAEIEAIRRDLDKLAWKRHTFYQSLIDQGFNSEQAMQILLNEF